MLDYKIKELKRDIGPRELEIQTLNEQTNKMRQELKHFNRVNLNLALIVDDLRMRQEGLTNEVQDLRQKLDEQEAYKKKFKDDVYECLHHTTDYKKLKAGVIRLHKIYVKEEERDEHGDTDMHREYQQRRNHLERNVNYLKQVMTKDQDVHKKENKKIMQENVYLLFEINDQIKEKHVLKQKIRENRMRIDELSSGQANLDGDGALFDGDIQRELMGANSTIQELTQQIEEYQQSNEMLRQQRGAQMGQMQPMDEQQMLQMQYQQEQMMMQQPMDAGMDMDQMDGAMEMDMGMGGEEAQPEQPPPEQQEPPAAEQPPPAMEEPPAEGGGQPEEAPAEQPPAEEPASAEPAAAPEGGAQPEAPAEQPPADMEGGDKPAE